jgi:hypothetical protein
MAEAKASASREGLSLQTLIVAAVASGIAAVVVSHVWEGGTVLAAAMTPVVVSIVKELLQRPIQSEAVRRSASRVGSVAAAPARRVATTAGTARTRSGSIRTVEAPPEVRGAPANGANGNGANGNGSAPGHDVIAAGPRRDYGADGSPARRRMRLTPRQWRIAIVTGVLAFVVAVAALTLPELIFGGAVGSGHGTTIFGGGSGSSSEQKDKQNNDQSNPNGGDQSQQQDQSQPNGSSTQPQKPAPQQSQPPSGTQTQTQPQQQPPPSSSPPSGGGGGSGGTQPTPQSPVPAPPVP